MTKRMMSICILSRGIYQLQPNKFHSLSYHAAQPLGIKEERIYLFVKGFNTDLWVLSIHMTSIEKSFNEISDYVKKNEGVKKVI